MAAEKGAKRNLTWGEWVGDQRLEVAALVGEDGGWEMWEQSPWLQWGHSKRARTILKPGQETSVLSLIRQRTPLQPCTDLASPDDVKGQRQGDTPIQSPSFRCSLCKVWSTNQQRQHRLETCQKCKCSALPSDLLHVNKSLNFIKIPRWILCTLKTQKD